MRLWCRYGALSLALISTFSCLPDLADGEDMAQGPSLRGLKVVSCELGLRVEFSGDMEPLSVRDDSFFVEGAKGRAGYDPVARAATFLPDEPFVSGASYVAVLTRDVQSAGGEPLSEGLRWQFVCIDRTPPVVVGKAPLGEGVSPLVFPFVRFSEALDETSLSAENVFLSGAKASLSYDPVTRTVTLAPERPLYPGRTYEVVVSPKVRDLAGNPLGAEVRWTFRVRPALDDWAARVTTPPVPEAAACDTPVELLWAPSFDPDWSFMGAAPMRIDGVAEVAFEVDEPSRIIRILPGAPLRPGGTYDVVATGTLRDRSGDAPFAAGQKVATIDVISHCDFPTLVRVKSAFGLVGCNGDLTVEFSRPMDSVSVAEAVGLFDFTAGGYVRTAAPRIEAAVTLSDDGFVATLTPLEPLTDGHRYWLEVGEDALSGQEVPLSRGGGWEITARCN